MIRPITLTVFGLAAAVIGTTYSAHAPTPKVALSRPPDGGIQPQAVVDTVGTAHMVYIKGANPGTADLFYVRKKRGDERWSDPIRVNSVANKVCAVGTV